MSQRMESSDLQPSTVGVWTPWGEQKVLRSDARFVAARLASKRQNGEDASPAHGSVADWTLGHG